MWPLGRPGPTRSTVLPRRWREPPASPRSARSSPPRRTPITTPVCRSRRCARWSRTGRRCEKCIAPFESGLPGPTGRVYHHEIPGGQLSNLRQQAIALGLGDRFEEVEEAYAGADRVLGRLVKVTPTSKVVGDLALALVGAGVSADEFASEPARFDIPESVLGFLRGELGDPPGGWPEPLRTAALAGRAAGQAHPAADGGRRGRPVAVRTQASGHPQPAAIPWPDKGIPRSTGKPTATLRNCRPTSSSTVFGRVKSTG